MKPRYRVMVSDQQTEYTCRQDENLLSEALNQGIRAIKRGCLGGGCGFCKVRVESGRYELGKCSVTVLTPEEKERGYVLACRTKPLSDLMIRIEK
ncbi:2Fe-2S iron-sulfur cluster-binding protein [Kyrpidia sp.]|uniref:2Fe-2S iron-sulfur cluster-binding protein n=1 Tax=Kyrpidia sp. TaxID=2073077 RepID=UPI00338F8552|nr:2Fe-2S iron-sulfur cluster binding domain-containing protein [Kyrpidia sp.]